MTVSKHGRFNRAVKLAAAAAIAAGTAVGVTHAASAGDVCLPSSCVVVQPVTVSGCSVDTGNAWFNSNPLSAGWTGPAASC